MIQIVKKIEYGDEWYWDDEYHLLIDGEKEWKEKGNVPNKEEVLKDECDRSRDELKMYKDKYEELKR